MVESDKNLITTFLASLSTKELINNDFDVMTLVTRIHQSVNHLLQSEGPLEAKRQKLLFLRQTLRSPIDPNCEDEFLEKQYIKGIFKEAYHTIAMAKMLRHHLSAHDVKEFSLTDVLNNYDTLSEPDAEFDIESKNSRMKQFAAFDQLQLVKGESYTILSASRANAYEIMRAVGFKIDRTSKDPLQIELSKMCDRLSRDEHWEIFRRIKGGGCRYFLPPEKVQRFFCSARGALTTKQWRKVYQALDDDLRQQFFKVRNNEIILNGITERELLAELVIRGVDVSLKPALWQRRKLLNRLTFSQIMHYAQMVFNTRIEDNSSLSHAKYEISHKFGFNGSAMFKAISSALSLTLERLGTFAQARLVLGLYGLHSDVMKGHSKNKKNRSKYLNRCRKVNDNEREQADIESSIEFYENALGLGKEELVGYIINMIERSGFKIWLRYFDSKQLIDCQLQSLIDIILARRHELGAKVIKTNTDAAVLKAFAEYIHKHRDKYSGIFGFGNQGVQQAQRLQGIAGFLAKAYKTVTPQVAMALNVLEFVFKAVVLTIAVSSLLTLIVAEATPVLVVTGLSAGIALILSVNKYYRMRNDYNTDQILDQEKNTRQSMRVGNERLLRTKYAFRFAYKCQEYDRQAQSMATPTNKTISL